MVSDEIAKEQGPFPQSFLSRGQIVSSQFDFAEIFKLLTGYSPFPWQVRMYEMFLAGKFPEKCNLPTGLAKTSVIQIHLTALAAKPDIVPRRLVYVVNRRTVVDQATEEAVKIRNQLMAEQLDPQLEKLKQVLTELAVLPFDQADVPFAISSLRGQFADNAEWRDDPARAAVIVGTVDMIGSRLLFRGYRSGFKSQPTHAGLLGQDTLIVHDEAHLEPAFQELLVAIKGCQKRDGGLITRATRIMELTATPRGSGEVFELNEEDRKHEVVKQRIAAAKGIAFHEVDDPNKLAGAITQHALNLKASQEAILIFLQSVENVTKVVAALEKEKQKVQHLTGTKRGWERDQLATKDRIFARFLPPRKTETKDQEPAIEPMPGTVYLVCTSAGEVGVNISADHLICDLTTFESMAQRFGRVNRFGEGDANIEIFHEAKIDPKNKYEESRDRTLKLLKQLPKRADGRLDASPRALGELPKADREAAFAPIPEILPVSDILFDAWTLTTIRDELPGRPPGSVTAAVLDDARTTIRDELPGRPPVADWLHGVPTDWEPPRTSVAWRNEVDLITEDILRDQMPPLKREDLLEAYPLKPHELLTDTAFRVFKSLEKLAKVHGDKKVWVLRERQKVEVHGLEKLIENGHESLQHATVILSPKMGGLHNGLLSGSAAYNPQTPYDVADEWFDDHKPPRQRRQRRRDDEKPLGMREVCKIDLTALEEDRADQEEDSTTIDVWHWYVRPKFAEDDDSFSRQAPKPQVLNSHLKSAKDYAEKIVKALGLPKPEATAVIIAAELHDLGKDRKLWQHGIWNKEYNRENPETILAKSNNTRRPANQHYRHEFGTIVELANEEISRKIHPIFWDQPKEVQDLIRHLIAAHHGRGRPHFPQEEAFDPEAFSRADLTQEGIADLACEVPQRFARLQRKYGRWGLAWLESLVRAADVMASRDPKEES